MGPSGGLTLNAVLTKTGAGTLVLNTPGAGTAPQVTVNGGTLRLNSNAALSVNPHVTVNDGGTVHFHNFTTTGNSAAIGVWLNNGATWKTPAPSRSPRAARPGINNGSPGNPVHAYINVEGPTDTLTLNSQVRNQVNHDPANPSQATLHFNGEGTTRIMTGGTGADPILYSGAIEVSNGKLLFGPRTAGTAAAETLNAAGFAAEDGSARKANTVTITGGIVGGMNNNPKLPSDGATQPPAPRDPAALPRQHRPRRRRARDGRHQQRHGGTFTTDGGGIAGSRWGGHFTVAPGTSRVLVYDPLQTTFPADATGNSIALVAGARADDLYRGRARLPPGRHDVGRHAADRPGSDHRRRSSTSRATAAPSPSPRARRSKSCPARACASTDRPTRSATAPTTSTSSTTPPRSASK